MRLPDLSERKRTGSMSCVLLIAAGAVLLATGMAGEALGQSANERGTAVSSGGFGRGPGATPPLTGNVTPAFSTSPTPAFSSTPTPAPSSPQTSPVGSGRPPGGTTGTISADADISVSASDNEAASTDRTGAMAAGDGDAAQGLRSGLSGRRAASTSAVGATGPSSVNRQEIGNAFANSRSGSAEAREDGSSFVIVAGATSSDSLATAATQFTMICNGSDIQATCKAGPRFVMSEQ